MKSKHIIDPQLAIADLYRLLAYSFDFPTDERIQLIREISSGLLVESPFVDEIATMLKTLNESISQDEMIADYSLIFIKGGIPLNESHTMNRMNSVADVSSFYRAFGFSAKTGENPDSIMHELEFMALLKLKSNLAPNVEAKAITEKAYADFLSDHLGDYALEFASRIRRGNAGVFFLTASFLLEAFINHELQLLKLQTP